MSRKIKKKVLWVLCLALLAQTRGFADLEETFTTGRNWSHHMSPREKFMSLLPPVFLFAEYDVRLRHSLPQYIHWIDKILERNPELEGEDVGNLFVSTIFLLEPENREAIRTMETNFLRGDFEKGAYVVPQLSIEQVAAETSGTDSEPAIGN